MQKTGLFLAGLLVLVLGVAFSVSSASGVPQQSNACPPRSPGFPHQPPPGCGHRRPPRRRPFPPPPPRSRQPQPFPPRRPRSRQRRPSLPDSGDAPWNRAAARVGVPGAVHIFDPVLHIPLRHFPSSAERPLSTSHRSNAATPAAYARRVRGERFWYSSSPSHDGSRSDNFTRPPR